jgi:hypothetical protein
VEGSALVASLKSTPHEASDVQGRLSRIEMNRARALELRNVKGGKRLY